MAIEVDAGSTTPTGVDHTCYVLSAFFFALRVQTYGREGVRPNEAFVLI
jgi:hypothetical protein